MEFFQVRPLLLSLLLSPQLTPHQQDHLPQAALADAELLAPPAPPPAPSARRMTSAPAIRAHDANAHCCSLLPPAVKLFFVSARSARVTETSMYVMYVVMCVVMYVVMCVM
jgi:hypothetical protein